MQEGKLSPAKEHSWMSTMELFIACITIKTPFSNRSLKMMCFNHLSLQSSFSRGHFGGHAVCACPVGVRKLTTCTSLTSPACSATTKVFITGLPPFAGNTTILTIVDRFYKTAFSLGSSSVSPLIITHSPTVKLRGPARSWRQPYVAQPSPTSRVGAQT